MSRNLLHYENRLDERQADYKNKMAAILESKPGRLNSRTQ
jgi:hypothetical protein